MHYVYLTNNIVTDQCQIDPYKVFNESYAALFIEAPNEVTFDWSLDNGTWTPPPGPTPEDIKEENKLQATALLSQTDWTAIESVANPAESNPYLTNRQEFLAYRSAVRAIAVNPPTTPAVFPTQPEPVWSNT